MDMRYAPPLVVETFDALDVMGTAEGSGVDVVGNGSDLQRISLAG